MTRSPDPHADPFAALLPEDAASFPRGLYDPHPAFTPSEGEITIGYGPLAERVVREMPEGLRVLVVDGFHGVDWDAFRSGLERVLGEHGVEAEWLDMAACLASPDVLHARLAPFLGGGDPIFGTHFPLGPDVFFDAAKVADFRIRAAVARGRAAGALTVVYGCGAGLVELWDRLWYADVPKDALQARARAGRLKNLGDDEPAPFNLFYKRAYFAEWPALNRLKRRLLPDLDLFLDLQDEAAPAAMDGDAFRRALRELSGTPFRPRPWFYRGPWGGRFMQGHMGVQPEAPNLAWSFELITPENGIVLERHGLRLECSFDTLMAQENERMLGREAARQFQFEWPLRLDYLDTVDGGNLSVQCHPRPDYIRKEFGETFTQDETYYITNAKPDARVYIGLHEEADPEALRRALASSAAEGVEVDVGRFVHSVESRPHDLFLIPNGTIHCSGAGNLVLEISATPYIFTFKVYDYLRRDLEGNLRPINLDRAWANLRFERRGPWVRENLVAQPRLLREGPGWKEFVLMDRPEFFYNIHRLEFERAFAYDTEDRALAVNLVEGDEVELVTANGRRTTLRYLESLVIPAATGRFEVVPRGERPCKLVLVYVRPGTGVAHPLNEPTA